MIKNNELETRLHSLWKKSQSDVERPDVPVDLFLNEAEIRYNEYLKEEGHMDSSGLMAMMH